MRQTEDYGWLRTLGVISSIGFLILIATGIGLIFGLWLDRMLGTTPWLAFVFTMLGLASGLVEAVRILVKAGE
ncbi:MAG: AtpZ/AtpI family protein [Armatimonadetes bacterium]|nr:AtpZ/AtpI family protein [Armatimonadota bacterium]